MGATARASGNTERCGEAAQSGLGKAPEVFSYKTCKPEFSQVNFWVRLGPETLESGQRHGGDFATWEQVAAGAVWVDPNSFFLITFFLKAPYK